MKKLILTLVLAVCSFQVGFSQEIDQKTLNIFAVKLMSMENMYNEGKYREVIEKAEEIENLVAGFESEKAQNFKVKAYIGLGMYERAKTELDKLYNMSYDEEVLADIASYAPKIDEGIAEEKAGKERARLAEIKREEDTRLAEVKKQEKIERIAEAISHFEYESCNKCEGKGLEEYETFKKCTGSYSGPNRGGGMKRYYRRCKGGKCETYKKGGIVESFTCTTCKGSGKVIYKAIKECSVCQGTFNVLKYIGNDDFSKEEIEDIIKYNRSEIDKSISEKK